MSSYGGLQLSGGHIKISRRFASSRTSGSEMKERLFSSLKQVFGFDEFRGKQLEAITGAVEGQDVFVLMPTGGGKSLCYIMPALIQDGVVVVLSPLIALMEDQVKNIRSKGIACDFLSSSQKESEKSRVLKGLNADRPTIKLLFATPEACNTESFKNILRGLYSRGHLALFAIDEAHCISSWGHDFRPAYRKLSILRTELPKVPIMALTATAADAVRKDIIKDLRLKSPLVLMSSFDRPNIHYSVQYVRIGEEDSYKKLPSILGNASSCGIIYCLKRDTADWVAKKLKEEGIVAASYHAKLPPAARTKVLADWSSGKIAVVAATVAFGMGIDKPDVRCVIHMNLPKTMSAFYQESGRAGRDGLPSRSVLFYDVKDRERMDWLLSKQEQDKKRKRGDEKGNHGPSPHAAFGDVVNYATSVMCRRAALLKHFGEKLSKGSCSGCDVCDSAGAVTKKLAASGQGGSGGRSYGPRWEDEQERILDQIWDEGYEKYYANASFAPTCATSSSDDEVEETAEEVAAARAAKKARGLAECGGNEALFAQMEQSEQFYRCNEKCEAEGIRRSQNCMQTFTTKSGFTYMAVPKVKLGAAPVNALVRDAVRLKIANALSHNTNFERKPMDHMERIATDFEAQCKRASATEMVYKNHAANAVRRAAALPYLPHPGDPLLNIIPAANQAGQTPGAAAEAEAPASGASAAAGPSSAPESAVAASPASAGLSRSAGGTCTAPGPPATSAGHGPPVHSASTDPPATSATPRPPPSSGGPSGAAAAAGQSPARNPAGETSVQQPHVSGKQPVGVASRTAVGQGPDDELARGRFAIVEELVAKCSQGGAGDDDMAAAVGALSSLESCQVSAKMLRETGMGRVLKQMSKHSIPVIASAAANAVEAFKRCLVQGPGVPRS